MAPMLRQAQHEEVRFCSATDLLILSLSKDQDAPELRREKYPCSPAKKWNRRAARCIRCSTARRNIAGRSWLSASAPEVWASTRTTRPPAPQGARRADPYRTAGARKAGAQSKSFRRRRAIAASPWPSDNVSAFPSPSSCRTATAPRRTRRCGPLAPGWSSMAPISTRQVEAMRLAEQENLTFAPSFHRDLVLGVSTWALELLEAAPGLDVLYVPIGLGSGICGAIMARDLLGLQTEIVGVQSENAPHMPCRSRRAMWWKPIPPTPTPTGWRRGCPMPRRWR